MYTPSSVIEPAMSEVWRVTGKLGPHEIDYFHACDITDLRRIIARHYPGATEFTSQRLTQPEMDSFGTITAIYNREIVDYAWNSDVNVEFSCTGYGDASSENVPLWRIARILGHREGDTRTVDLDRLIDTYPRNAGRWARAFEHHQVRDDVQDLYIVNIDL